MGYHNSQLKQIYEELQSSEKGLSTKDVEEKLKQFGRNELTEAKKITPLEIFINQFKSFIVGILIVVMVFSIALKEITDAIAVFVILILNAVFGFVQEYKADKAIEALKKLASPKAAVIRDGKEIEIDTIEIVPGDIIVLATGIKIPADSRLVEEMNLETQEAALTGESLPVKKEVHALEESIMLANRNNMVYAGTIVTKGRGKAIVIATGMKTEFGKIAQLIQSTPEEPTPLQNKLKELGHSLGILTIVICIMIFGVGIYMNHNWLEMIETSLALAVAAIPEGLAAVVTISLALGVQRMIKRNALIRKLPSVETLGSTTVICTDKTGTLTHNEMTVKKLYVNSEIVDVSGSGYSAKGDFTKDPKTFDMLIKIGLLNNDAEIAEGKVIGDPTEACLIVSAQKAGMKKQDIERQYPRVDEIPFDSERKMMTTIHNVKKCLVAFTKGSPEGILKNCDRILIDGKVQKLTPQQKQKITKTEYEFAEKALRVLAFSYKELGKEGKKEAEKDMIFVGLQAMIDPPREEVRDAIAKCKKAGIKVVMVTGDSKITAHAIAKELGIEGKAISGAELENIKELEKEIDEIGIYARVNPEHKSMIVDAFKKKGHIVAMTGDGVNDAPALKKADIGVSMGITGTDVAREASDMILTDDNFTSIVNAVEEGRGIYANIKKFVQYLLSCNIGEVFTIFLGVLLGLPTPLLPIQILLMNLVTDGLPALALGVEPIEKEIMNKKPRKPEERIFSRGVLFNMVFIGFIISIGTLFIFNHFLPKGIEYTPQNIVYAQTIAFTTLVMFQLFNVFNLRSEKSIFKVGFFNNKFVLGAVLSSIIIQLAIIYTPLNDLFNTVAINPVDWLFILATSLSIIAIVEIYKFIASKFSAQ